MAPIVLRDFSYHVEMLKDTTIAVGTQQTKFLRICPPHKNAELSRRQYLTYLKDLRFFCRQAKIKAERLESEITDAIVSAERQTQTS